MPTGLRAVEALMRAANPLQEASTKPFAGRRDMTRYPDIHVTVRSSNPLALVAAVRQAMRQAGLERGEIRRFSQEALTSEEPGQVRDVCRAWVDAALP